MNEGEPKCLKSLSAEEIATTAHAIVTGKNSQIHVLRQRIADLEARPCPHVVSTDEGTQYCGLAEGRVRELETRADMAERDAADSRKVCADAVDALAETEDELAQAEAEVKRLREAIEALSASFTEGDPVRDWARKALENTP